MKKMIFVLLAAAVMCGCNSGVSYTVTVSAPDEVADVQLVTYDREMSVLAEAVYNEADGVFKMKGKAETPMLAVVTDAESNPLTVVFIEKGHIDVVFDEDSGEFRVSGTPANDNAAVAYDRLGEIEAKFYAAEEMTPELQEEIFDEYNAAVAELVEENNDNLLGAYLFAGTAEATMEPAEILDRIARFPKELRETPMLKSVGEAAKSALKTSVGQRYIDIAAPDTDGETVKLSEVVGEGRWVLVDFWATWCGPCRGELPYLRDAYAEYADKGFVIFGVSLDNNAEAWRTFVADNDMTWINVLDVDDERNSPAADNYGIRSIPTNFLISPEGEIVAKNLRGEAVGEKLAEIFE